MTNCLILGSGRCGTSALAGALAHSGVFTSLHPRGPTPQMPTGYFEDRWVNQWNDELIAQGCGGTYGGLLVSPVPLGLDHSKMNFTDPVRVRRMMWFQPYALKDPRFAYTYPVWKRILVQPTVCLVLFRNPAAFTSSAVRLKSDFPHIVSDLEVLLGLWENSYRHTLSYDDGSFYYIEYEEIISGRVFPFLESLLGYSINRTFVDPKLAHTGGGPTGPKAGEVYEILCRRAQAKYDQPLSTVKPSSPSCVEATRNLSL